MPGVAIFTTPLRTILLDKLEKYTSKIRKVEVHLSDENGKKQGPDDKRCLLEVHMDEMESVVGTNHADTYEEALTGAIEHLKTMLNKKLGKDTEYKQANL